MSAVDNLNVHQLKMFMSPNELRAEGYRPWEDVPALKMAEADDWGMTESIRSEGVKRPIMLSRYQEPYSGEDEENVIVNGHHRFFTQEHVDPDRLMPVMHGEDPWSANREAYKIEEQGLADDPDSPSQYKAGGLRMTPSGNHIVSPEGNRYAAHKTGVSYG